ncbi:MAG: DUF1918 domain-containing protein, partial [Nocardioidaceae bacterium]
SGAFNSMRGQQCDSAALVAICDVRIGGRLKTECSGDRAIGLCCHAYRSATLISKERRKEAGMRAQVGDELIIDSRQVGLARRDGEILEVRGVNGEPPYLVRWSDDGRVTLVFPGPDARVHRIEHRKR